MFAKISPAHAGAPRRAFSFLNSVSPVAAAVFLFCLIASLAPPARATSQDWRDSGYTDGNWNVANNWYENGVPGAVGTLDTNKDMASFDSAHNLTVTVDSARSIADIIFDTSFAGAFTLQGGNLYVSFSGYIYIKSGVANSETVNSAIFLPSTGGTLYTFIDSSTNSGVSLNIGGAVTGRQTAGNTGTLMLDGVGNGSVSGVISDGSAGGKVAVNKTSTGTWTMAGANTYTGATQISAGTLLINGNQSSATGGVTVTAAGSTLGGTGTIGGAVMINGGAKMTGATVGTTGTLTLQSTATFSGATGSLATYLVDLSSSQSDKLVIAGTLNLNGTSDQIQFQGTSGASSYTLATYSSVVGTFDSVSGMPSGYKLDYGATALTLTEVPEPCTVPAGALALLVLGYSTLRKKLGGLRNLRLDLQR
ncbi:MAG TPA: autotransporter-associated beta strand repeat-containing protein [Chthoniobacterales bacterium]|jgi:autotransporter-associated beta strand protein